MRLSGPYQTIQLTLVRCRLAFCHSLHYNSQLHLATLQVWASRVRFNLTLIPERFPPQKLTQVEQLSLWPTSSKQTTRPPVHFALLPGPPAPHGASCDESILRCRAGGCGMTNKVEETTTSQCAAMPESTTQPSGDEGISERLLLEHRTCYFRWFGQENQSMPSSFLIAKPSNLTHRSGDESSAPLREVLL